MNYLQRLSNARISTMRVFYFTLNHKKMGEEIATLEKSFIDQVISWFRRAIEINKRTEYCIDITLTGNWNQIEVLVYWSKSIKEMETIIWTSFSLNRPDDEKISDVETVFYNIEQDFINN